MVDACLYFISSSNFPNDVVVYKDGKPAATQVGAMNKNELTDWIQSLL